MMQHEIEKQKINEKIQFSVSTRIDNVAPHGKCKTPKLMELRKKKKNREERVENDLYGRRAHHYIILSFQFVFLFLCVALGLRFSTD